VLQYIGMLQVVAAIIEREGKVLICQRKMDQSHALKWEFPGGKVETGETPEDALTRELEEELAIDHAAGREIQRYTFAYPGKQPIELIFFRVESFSGEPLNRVFHEMRWAAISELESFDFLEGDAQFLRWFARENEANGRRQPAYTVAMTPGIKMVDPQDNEFLEGLEKKSQRASHFFRTMANRPEVLKTFVPFYAAVVGPGAVERRIKELVYLTCSFANECAYCAASHTTTGKKAGITEEELRALRTEQDGAFSEPERAAIAYARELTRTADGEESREGLFAHFTHEQIVEITLVAAMANFTNRFNNGLMLQPES
jgi:8-oxo-dGTP diphosphatase